MTTEWYEVDGGAIVAVAPAGMFVLAPAGTDWHWLVHGSDAWDAMHQNLYRNHRARLLPGPPEGAPPLPPAGAPPQNDRDSAGDLRSHPGLVAWIGIGRTVFVALSEDTWESRFGDGVFRYFVGCFPTEAEAMHCPLPSGDLRHVRRVGLTVANGGVVTDPQREGFADRYEVAAALADLVARLPLRG